MRIQNNTNFVSLIFALVLWAIGYALIWRYVNGWAALGVFLVQWGSNIEHT